MLINYWNEIEFVSQAPIIALLSIAISSCFVASLFNLSKFYRDKKPLKVRTVLIQLFVLSILTAILVVVKNSLATASPYRNAKIESILTKYWHDRESSPQFWNTLQSTYKCCGVNGSTDWEPNVPLSCYQSDCTDCTWLIWRKTVTCPEPHERGCYGIIVKYFDDMTCWFDFIGLNFILLGSFAILAMLLTLISNFVCYQTKAQRKSLEQI